MKSHAATYYAVDARVWYRAASHDTTFIRGIVEEIALDVPTVSYFVRLESKDSVWAEFSQLLPR